MNSFDWGSFFDLLSLHYYNSERRAMTSDLIKSFIIKKDFDLEKEKELFLKNEEKDLVKEAFSGFDSVVTSGLEIEEVSDYLLERYLGWREAFYKQTGISFRSFFHFSWEIMVFAGKKANGIELPVYSYKNKQEYVDRGFLAKPSDVIKTHLGNTFVLDLNALRNHIEESIKLTNAGFVKECTFHNKNPIVSEFDKLEISQFEKFLELCSFNVDKLKLKKIIRFKEYPFFIHDERLVILENKFFFYLPQKVHKILLGSKSFKSSKGQDFETMALKLIEKVPYGELNKNIKYDTGELDGLLNMRRSSWFVECKSRVLSSESLLGDKNKIDKDLEKGIIEGISQAEKAINASNQSELNKFNPKLRKGVLIITEAVFPNESQLILPYIFGNKNFSFSKQPCVIFNYFELKKILEQKDKHLFEEFLIWRAQKPMPIFCIDELDYWAFFCDWYLKNKEIKKSFEVSKKNSIRTFYISKRFNNKKYLDGIVNNENKNT